MKSRISIDLDELNNPIIKIEYNQSDDLRDVVVKRFLESFGGDSQWAKFNFKGNVLDIENQTAYISPIKPFDLPEECKQMMIDCRKYMDVSQFFVSNNK